MEQVLLWTAAVTAGLTAWIHTVVGGRRVARPVLDSALPPAAKWLSYYCWHMSTVTVSAMSLAFALSALTPELRPLAWGAAALAAVFSLLSAAVALKGRIPPLRFPSTSLFAVTALAGAGAALLA